MFVSSGSFILLLTACYFQIQPSKQVCTIHIFELQKVMLKLIFKQFSNIFFFNKVTETKLLRYECNTSGITVSYIKCRARSISRNIQVADIEYEVKTTVRELKVFLLKLF